MRRYVASVLVAAAALVAGSVGTALAVVGSSSTWVPPDDTIVDIRGDAANGFAIRHYDGSALFPPTDSEARAECSEYDTQVERVRCRTEVRTWYRDLGADPDRAEVGAPARSDRALPADRADAGRPLAGSGPWRPRRSTGSGAAAGRR